MGQSTVEPEARKEFDQLRAVWAEAGRDPAALRLDLIYNPLPDAPTLGESLVSAREMEAERLLYHVFEGDRDTMLRRLDRAMAALG